MSTCGTSTIDIGGTFISVTTNANTCYDSSNPQTQPCIANYLT